MVKSRISKRTFEDRASVIRRQLKPALGYFELSEVRAVNFSILYDKLLASGLSAQTVRKTHSFASLIFRDAVALELLPTNPMARVKPPKIPQTTKTKVMTLPEVRRFLEVCRDAPHGIIFEFAIETGMRPQEYLALRWSDIDLLKQSVEVTRALVFDNAGGGFYFKEPKTIRSRRRIPLSKQLVEKLQLHRTNQKIYVAEITERIRRRAKPSREQRKVKNRQMLDNYKTYNLVFPSKDFTPLSDINLGKRYFKAAALAAGLSSDLSLYSLRPIRARQCFYRQAKILRSSLNGSDTQMFQCFFPHIVMC